MEFKRILEHRKAILFVLIAWLTLLLFSTATHAQSSNGCSSESGYSDSELQMQPGVYAECGPIGTAYNGPNDTTSIGSGYETTIQKCNDLNFSITPQDAQSCLQSAGTSSWTQYSMQKVVWWTEGSYGDTSPQTTFYADWSNGQTCSIADKYGSGSQSNGWLYAGQPDCSIGSPYKVCCALQTNGTYIPAPAQSIQPYSGAPQPNGIMDAVCQTTYEGLPVTMFGPNQTSCPAPQKPVSTTANLTVQAADLFYHSLQVAVTTSLGSGTTQFEESLSIPQGTNPTSNVTISAPSSITQNGSTWPFVKWAFSDTPYTYSTPTSVITLNNDFSNRTAVAYYAQPSYKWYYCSTQTNPNSCVETQNPYPDQLSCQTALSNFLGGKTTGTCYQDNGSCQTACVTKPPTGGGSGGGNGGGGCTGPNCTGQQYAFCSTTDHKYEETQNSYQSVQDCETALSQNLPGQTTGVCYSDLSLLGQSCGISPACTGSSCPSVTLKALPSTINYGQSSELTWTSSNADSCTGTPGSFNVPGSQGYQFDSGTSLNGSARAFPTQTTNYTLTCSNSSGSNSASTSTTVTVNSVNPQGCTTPPCNTGGDVGITSFKVNNTDIYPSPKALACVPEHPGNNNDSLSWQAKTGNSCPSTPPVPPSTGSCSGGSWTWYSVSPSNTSASCSISSNPSGINKSGLPSSDSYFPISQPAQSTDYALECTRNTYSCLYSGVYRGGTEPATCIGAKGPYPCRVSCDPQPSVSNYNGQYQPPASHATVSNTLIVMQPPIISNFSPNRVNILIHQPVDLGWNSTPQSSDSILKKVVPDSFCYSGGGSGDTSGWNATADNPFKVDYLDNLLPQKSTIYNLICRSAYAQNNSCYAESNAQTQVNVFSTTPSETNPTSFLETLHNFFAKTGGPSLLGSILGGI